MKGVVWMVTMVGVARVKESVVNSIVWMQDLHHNFWAWQGRCNWCGIVSFLEHSSSHISPVGYTWKTPNFFEFICPLRLARRDVPAGIVSVPEHSDRQISPDWRIYFRLIYTSTGGKAKCDGGGGGIIDVLFCWQSWGLRAGGTVTSTTGWHRPGVRYFFLVN